MLRWLASAAPAMPMANRPMAAGSGIEEGLPPDDPPVLPPELLTIWQGLHRTKVDDNLPTIKVGMGVHAIIEGSSVIEKATGEAHPTVFWVIDVARA